MSGKQQKIPRDIVDVEQYQSYRDFSIEEVNIIIEILSIFDNRHDFKEGGRNKSLTIDEVLLLLKDKANTIRTNIANSPLNSKKQLLFDLLNIHCKDIIARLNPTQRECKTRINPDSEVEEYMFTEIFKEPLLNKILLKDKVKYTDTFIFPSGVNTINKKIIRFADKQAIANACGCTVVGPGEGNKVVVIKGQRNNFLDNLLKQLGTEIGVNPGTIQFCIDVSSIGEWVFRHDGIETGKSSTHLVTIADDYDTFRRNPHKSELPAEFSLKRNHIALSSFDIKTQQLLWNNQHTINLFQETRAGVSLMAEAIRAVLDKTKAKSKQVAIKLIQDIFGTYLPSLPIEYGKHIMDFKRLMDMIKLAVTQLYHIINSNTFVILVTHDHLLFLLAKMLQCPVILTIKNSDHSREMYIDIVSKISPEERQKILKQKQEKIKELLTNKPSIVPLTLQPLKVIKEGIPLNTQDPYLLFNYITTQIIEYFTKEKDLLENIPSEVEEVNNLLTNINTYNDVVTRLNTVKFSNTDLAKNIATMQTALHSSTYSKKYTPILYQFVKFFSNIVVPIQPVPTHSGRISIKPTTQNTEFLRTLTKILKTQKGGTNEEEMGKYALDLLYKYIDKNIERYYAQPLHIQKQMILEAYQELNPPVKITLEDFKNETEGLFTEYIKNNKSDKKAFSAPAILPVQEGLQPFYKKALSAPAILPVQEGLPSRFSPRLNNKKRKLSKQADLDVKGKKTNKPVTHIPPQVVALDVKGKKSNKPVTPFSNIYTLSEV